MPEVRAQIIITAKDEASANLNKIGKAGAGMGGELKKGLGGAATALTGINLASVGVAGAIIGVAAALKYSVEQAAESQKIMAVTESVIKSTGGAAGLTATQIESMAGRLSQLNAIDDETIQSAQNLLLTFKKIKGEGFEAASQAAIDLSVVMGIDLRGAAMMVGKALEDPVRGVTALRRAGVSFTAEQQKMIKSLVETGRAAEAQEFILKELNSQVGGAGVAVAKTYAGQMVLLKTNVDNVAESIGSRLLPSLTSLTSALNKSFTKSELLNKAADAGVISFKTYAGIQILVSDEVLTVDQRTEELTVAIEKQEEALSSEETKFKSLIPVIEESAQATEHAGRANVDTAGTAERLAAREEALTKSLMDNKLAYSNLHDVMGGAVGNELASYEDKQADLEKQIGETTAELEKYRAKNGLVYTAVTDTTDATLNLTIAQADAQKSALNLADAQKDLSENTDPDKQLQLEAAVARAQLAFNNSQTAVGEWNLALEESGGTYITNYGTQIGGLEEQLAGLQGAYDENAAAHELATKRILFDITEQQIANQNLRDGVDGMTADQIGFLQSLALEWGLTDKATFDATTQIMKWVGEAAASGDWDNLRKQVEYYGLAITSIPTSWKTTITTEHVDTWVTSQGLDPTDFEHGGPSGSFGSGGTLVAPASFGSPAPSTSAARNRGGGGAGMDGLLVTLPGMIARAVRDGLVGARV